MNTRKKWDTGDLTHHTKHDCLNVNDFTPVYYNLNIPVSEYLKKYNFHFYSVETPLLH